MVHLIYFSTDKFDPEKETPNPVNPIPGESVLLWLREQLAGTPYTTTAPDAEDWGWYIDVSGNDGSYMVGASGDLNETTDLVDWIFQVHKHRTFLQKVTGENKFEHNDELVSLITDVIRRDPTMRNIIHETEA